MEPGILFQPRTNSFNFTQVLGKFLSLVINVCLQVDFFFPFNGMFWMFQQFHWNCKALKNTAVFLSLSDIFFSFSSPFPKHKEEDTAVEGSVPLKDHPGLGVKKQKLWYQLPQRVGHDWATNALLSSTVKVVYLCLRLLCLTLTNPK